MEDLNSYDSHGLSILMSAAQKTDEEKFIVLLDEHAHEINFSLTAKEKTVFEGYNVIHFLAENPKSLRMLTNLLQLKDKHQIDFTCLESSGKSALHLAATKGNLAGIQIFLKLFDDNFINLKDKYGRTALMLACSQGHSRCTREIVHSGVALLDEVDQDGNTALHHAFQAQSQPLFGYNYPLMPSHLECAVELIKAGADVEIENALGDTALEYAEENVSDILEFLSCYKELFQNDSNIDDITSTSSQKLLSHNVPDEDIQAFEKLAEGYRKAEEIEREIRNSRGSCPFVDSSSIPKIRKFRNPLKLQAQMEKVQKYDKEPIGMPFGMPFGIKPNHNQFGEYQEMKQGVCPLGFVGPKPDNHGQIMTLPEVELEKLKAKKDGFLGKTVLFWNSRIRPFLPSPIVAASATVAIFSLFYALKYSKGIQA